MKWNMYKCTVEIDDSFQNDLRNGKSVIDIIFRTNTSKINENSK